jgi:hypothetical protein
MANPPRWRTPFGRWLRAFGVARLQSELARRGAPLTKQSLYHWASGRRRPRIQHAVELLRLSKGALTLEDFHRKESAMATLYPGSHEYLVEMVRQRVSFHMRMGKSLGAARRLAQQEADEYQGRMLEKFGVRIAPPGAVKIV